MGKSNPTRLGGVGAFAKAHVAIIADQDLTLAAASNLRLLGFAANESAGTAAAATFRILHGSIASGTLVAPVELAGNESKAFWFGDGVVTPDGVSIDVVAGTVDVVLFYAHA